MKTLITCCMLILVLCAASSCDKIGGADDSMKLIYSDTTVAIPFSIEYLEQYLNGSQIVPSGFYRENLLPSFTFLKFITTEYASTDDSTVAFNWVRQYKSNYFDNPAAVMRSSVHTEKYFCYEAVDTIKNKGIGFLCVFRAQYVDNIHTTNRDSLSSEYYKQDFNIARYNVIPFSGNGLNECAQFLWWCIERKKNFAKIIDSDKNSTPDSLSCTMVQAEYIDVSHDKGAEYQIYVTQLRYNIDLNTRFISLQRKVVRIYGRR